MSLKLLCCALLASLAVVSAANAEDAFYAKAKAHKVAVVEHAFPQRFAPGKFVVTMRIKNVSDMALRGALRIISFDQKGQDYREHGKAEIDIPPSTVSDTDVSLEAKCEFTTAELKRKVQIVLSAPTGSVICHEGVLAETPEAIEARKAAIGSINPAAARNHEVRFVNRLPAGDGAAWRKFIEQGGVLIVPLIASAEDFAGALEFCDEKSMPSFRPQQGPAHGGDLNVFPGATPLFDWPVPLSPHLRAGNGRLSLPGNARNLWDVVQRDYTVALRVGGGMLILSTHTCADSPELRKNIAAHLALEKDGIRLTEITHSYLDVDEYKGKYSRPALGGGETVVKVRNADFADTNLYLAARLTLTSLSDRRMSRTFVTRRRPSTKLDEMLDFKIQVPPLDLCGEWNAKTELLDWEGGKSWVLDERKVVFPEMLEIVPPDYRATVSTERRDAGVYIGIKLNRLGIDMGGKAWKLSAKDGAGRVVASAEGRFAPESRYAEAKLPVAKDAPAGRYALEAEVETLCGGKKILKSEFFIAAPEKGQIIIDQDGFFLNEGKPYFPLGIYHCHGFDWNTPIDETGLKPADMGFNWMQMWDWDWRDHYTVDRKILGMVVDSRSRGQRKTLAPEEREKEIDRLVATNKINRAGIKDVVVCYEGFGLWNNVLFERPAEIGKYSFECNESFPQIVKSVAEDPDQLVKMWYLADEAGGNMYKELRRAGDWLRRYDKRLHPVFNLGNMPAVLSGDVGGNDIYLRYYGGLGEARIFAERVENMRKEYAKFHRRPFIVPQAFGKSKSQYTETPEWVRLESYISIIHGANGIGFYCWKQTGDWDGKHAQGMGWNPPTAHMVKKLIEEIKVLHPALRVPGQKNLKSLDANVHALLCGDAAAGRYLIAVNTLEGAVDTELPVPGLSGMKLEPMFGAPKAKHAGGVLGIGTREALSVKLPAWGTAVWRVK